MLLGFEGHLRPAIFHLMAGLLTAAFDWIGLHANEDLPEETDPAP